MDKKELLKKAVKKEVAAVEKKEEKDEKEMDGEGGPFVDAVKKGYGNIKNGVNKAKTKVQNAITKGIVKFIGDTPAGTLLKEGLEKQKQDKMRSSLSNFHTTSKKNADGEIINPTKTDIDNYNKRFKTITKNK